MTQGTTSIQVRLRHSRTICWSLCQAVGSPATLPTMNPTIGQPITMVNVITTA